MKDAKRMNKLVLVTGGARSGKSAYAQTLAESLPGKHLYIATCPKADPAADTEMAKRISDHILARKNRGWQTVEETVDLAGIIDANSDKHVILVDCLTLWVSNQLLAAGVDNIDEDIIAARCHKLIAACHNFSGTIIMVTNEVGMGVVPGNALARKFRDLSGRCNQVVATTANEVFLLISTIPMKIKG